MIFSDIASRDWTTNKFHDTFHAVVSNLHYVLSLSSKFVYQYTITSNNLFLGCFGRFWVKKIPFRCLISCYYLSFSGNTWPCYRCSFVQWDWLYWSATGSGPPYKCYCCSSWSWTCSWKYLLLPLQGRLLRLQETWHMVEQKLSLPFCIKKFHTHSLMVMVIFLRCNSK